MSGVKTVFGGATIQKTRGFKNVEELEEVFQVLKDNKVDTIDTAQIYGDSEGILGEAKAGSSFTIDTKVGGGFKPGTATKEGVVEIAKESLEKIGVDQVN